MHDYHKATEMVETATKKVEESGKSKVTKIHLTVGESSGYSADTILMYFKEVSANTVCENAEVVLTQPKAMLECPACGEVFPRKLMEYNCPNCGKEGQPSKIGTQVIIEEIEVE